MRIFDTPEMTELKKIYEPYKDENYKFIEGTPQEAIDAYNRYLDIMEEIRQKEIKSWFE